MQGEVIKFIISNHSVSLEYLFDWLKTEDAQPKLVYISEESALSPSQFVCCFFNELRKQSQWLLNHGSSTDEKTKEKTPISTKTPNLHNHATSPHTTTHSIEKLNLSSPAKSEERKFRPRLNLFTSPKDGLGSPQKLGFSSTPKAMTPASADSFNSSLWTSKDSSDTPPSSQFYKSWNACSENHYTNVQRSPVWQNKSLNNENRCKSVTKMSLGDFIVKESITPKSKGRRIKPTKLSPDVLQTSPTDGPFTNAAFQSPVQNQKKTVEDRLALKMDCDSIMKKLAYTTCSRVTTQGEINSPNTTSPEDDGSVECLEKTPERVRSCDHTDSLDGTSLERQTDVAHREADTTVRSDPTLVTCSPALDRLAQFFAFLLRENLCENLTTELCFLANLIVAVDSSNNGPRLPPLDTIHNCAYFAVHTLALLQDTLTLLTSTTLALLASAPAVSSFMPELQQKLDDYSREKLKKSGPIIQVPQDGNVSFQCDTDNVENFTSHLNFTSFRKQRDALYQLIGIWEKDHGNPGWNFQGKLWGRVQAILNIRDDPTNMVHLARLFRNQLLASCSTYSSALDEAGEEVLELLPSADRARLSRLQARISGPGVRRGPVPVPEFPGLQSFFQEFIRACGVGPFIQFLKLCFVDELLRLNDVEFSSEGNDGFADELTQKRYLECVTSTRLLAKFLAFAEFLPYHGSEEYSEQVMSLHRAVRQKVLPLFNVELCLTSALASHRLVLTLPWLVSYLAMMDRGSALLPAYSGVWGRLGALRRHLPPHLTPSGRLMLQLSLGWLYQVAPVPPDVVPCPMEASCEERGLDDMDVVSEAVLYHVCPYLCELNAVLSGSSPATSRHIRPTRTIPIEDRAFAAKQLELRLEGSFLQNQSQSTKRTIQFVSERTASCCIKDIAADVLPQIKIAIKERFLLQSLPNEVKMEQALEEWEGEVKSTSMEAAWRICRPRVAQSMTALLGRDVSEGAVQAVVALATRQAIEKVQSWIQSNALAATAKTEMKNYLENIADGNSDVKEEASENQTRRHHLTECITALRDAVWWALHGQLSDRTLQDVTAVTHHVLTSRTLPAPSERGVFSLLAELLIWSYVSSPGNIILSWQRLAKPLRDGFLRHPSNQLERVLCPRNFQLAANPEATRRLIELPLMLVSVGLLSPHDALLQTRGALSLKLPEGAREKILEAAAALQQLNESKSKD